MTLMTGYPDKKAAEEARKVKVRKPPEYQRTKQTKPHGTNNSSTQIITTN
jgi:hypothetical protein